MVYNFVVADFLHPTMTPAARRRMPQTPMPDPGLAGEMHEHADEAAQLLKALGNGQRLQVLCNLLERPLSVGELHRRMDLSQSALSQHLALLRQAGLVETRREAQSIYYSLPPGPATQIITVLQEIYCRVPPSRSRNSRQRRARTGLQSVTPYSRAR